MNTIEKNKLILANMPLVKRIALNLIVRLPVSIQVDDLIQAGVLGLIESAEKFDDTKGASFETYAGIRIRGAMLDELRKGDWVPRSVHRNTRKIQEVVQDLEKKHGSTVRANQVAKAMGISIQNYHKMRDDISCSKIYELEETGTLEENTLPVFVSTHSVPHEQAQFDDLKQKLQENINSLSEKEARVINLYYDEQCNLKEIGKIIGVSESRVSQIHAQATKRLHERMRNLEF